MKSDPYGTDDLFDPEPFQSTGTEKPKAARSVAQGNCPRCSAPKIGLIQTNGHLMWRLHNYTTHAGSRLPCPASGIYACDLPEALPTHSSDGIAVRCPHGRND